MGAAELEELAGVSDFQPSCPVKVTERETFAPILPVPVDEDMLAGMNQDPRMWKYQVC